MNIMIRRALCATLVMVSAAVLATALIPTKRLADAQSTPELEAMIPRTFGDWQTDEAGNAALVNPVVSKELRDLYSATLSRTYTNSQGYKIMLSIAYGGDQNRDLQVHRPEVCYVAQGFTISHLTKTAVKFDGQSIPVMRLESTQGDRHEPLTYWVRIGDEIVRGNIEQGIARLKYGLNGYIADGLLFRVSSIDNDTNTSFMKQDEFISSLLAKIEKDNIKTLIGQFSK